MAMTNEKFRGEWTAPAPKFIATQPEVADWSEGVQVPSVPTQHLRLKSWAAASTAQVNE